MMDLFAPVKVEPVLTDEEKAELEAVVSETIIAWTLGKIVNEVCPVTPSGRRLYDRVKMSDREYIVWKDGSLRRLPNFTQEDRS